MDYCIKVNKRLNTYGYGVPVDEKLIELEGPAFANAYRTMSVSEFEKYKGGVCWDYNMYQYIHLRSHGIRSYNFYIELHDPMSSTHTFTVVPTHNCYIYIESSYLKIQGVYVSGSLDAIISFVLSHMNPDHKAYAVRGYKIPTSGKTTLQFMDWCFWNGKEVKFDYVKTRTIGRGDYKEIVEV